MDKSSFGVVGTHSYSSTRIVIFFLLIPFLSSGGGDGCVSLLFMLIVGHEYLGPLSDGPTSGRPICSNSFLGIRVNVSVCQYYFQLNIEALFCALHNLLLLASFPNEMIHGSQVGCILEKQIKSKTIQIYYLL